MGANGMHAGIEGIHRTPERLQHRCGDDLRFLEQAANSLSDQRSTASHLCRAIDERKAFLGLKAEGLPSRLIQCFLGTYGDTIRHKESFPNNG